MEKSFILRQPHVGIVGNNRISNNKAITTIIPDNSVIFYYNTYCSYCFLEPIRFGVNSAFSRLSLRVVDAILPSFPECRRHILRLRNTILAAPLFYEVEAEKDKVCSGHAPPQRLSEFPSSFLCLVLLLEVAVLQFRRALTKYLTKQ